MKKSDIIVEVKRDGPMVHFRSSVKFNIENIVHFSTLQTTDTKKIKKKVVDDLWNCIVKSGINDHREIL